MTDANRSVDPAVPDLRDAAQVLAAYGQDLRNVRIELPEGAAGFSGALVLRASREDSVWSLRRWPRSGLTRPRLTGLHHFLRELGSAGIDVLPVPCTSHTGQTLIEHNGSLWQLEPWLPGRADFHQRPSDDRLRSAMQKMAQIHCVAEHYVPPPAGRQWFSSHPAAPSPACRERLQILHTWSVTRCHETRTLLEATAPAVICRPGCEILRGFQVSRGTIERELRTLRDVPVPLHPCLRDVWHDHVLFTGDEVTGIVDPSAARSENVASDLSRLLGSLLGDNRLRWETALGWYDDVRPLRRDEYRLITALDRSSVLLSGLTWIDRYLQAGLRQDDIPRVLPRMEAIGRRLEHLAATISH